MTSAIRLTVPGTLAYRPLAVRVVAEAARLVSGSEHRDPDNPLAYDICDSFDTAVVSAFMEIFNNVAMHAYRQTRGTIEIVVTPGPHELVIDVTDHGRPFDPHDVMPLPSMQDARSLPERGMGMHIATAMLDELAYQPGPPNQWRLCKRAWRRR